MVEWPNRLQPSLFAEIWDVVVDGKPPFRRAATVQGQLASYVGNGLDPPSRS
jgi:hypothetical protein